MNGKHLNEKAFRHKFYSHQEAENDALCCKPDPGVDYDVKEGEPEMKITYELRVPPENTELMNLVLVESMDKNIQAESKANCKTCQVNSDSQFDHCQSGNCLDGTYDHLDFNCKPAQKKIMVNHFMNIFDGLCTEIGVRPILSKQLAKGGLAWIPNDQILEKIQDVEIYNSPLMGVVRKVHANVLDL